MATHIVLADSDHITRTVLCYHLQQAGYHVDAVASADAAYLTLQDSPSALMIMDEELLHSQSLFARSQQRRPMVLLTSQPQISATIHGMPCVSLAKPFRARQLLQCIEALLASRAA